MGLIYLFTQEDSDSDTCRVIVVNFICRSQNDDGREGGDSEEYFTARMRWLRQEDNWEVSSWLWYCDIFFPPSATTCPFCGLRGPPSWAWQNLTDFWGWDTHEAQLRCPDGVWVVIEEDVMPGGALNLNYTNLPRPWLPWGSSPSRKIPTVEPGIEPRTSWLVVRDSTTRPRGWSTTKM